jgi:hypothetical protein
MRSIDIKMQHSQSLSQPTLQFEGQYYPLNKQRIVIGSDQSCNIRIENNPQVLPMHAQVISEAGQVFILYMERSATIWVNGLPASQQALHDQDEIAVGDRDTKLILSLNGKPTQSDEPITSPPIGFQAGQSVRQTQNPGASQPLPFVPIGASQPLPSVPIGMSQPLPPISNGQTFPSRGVTPLGANPAFGATQQLGLFAPMSQWQASSPGKATNTTRYLCAAGYRFEDFQHHVMRHVIYEERKALGESYRLSLATAYGGQILLDR